MKLTRIALSATLLGLCACIAAGSKPPLGSGTYTFQHRDAEFARSKGFPVSVAISGFQVIVTNPRAYGSIPSGEIGRGILMWHVRTRRWVLGRSEADRDAPQVGGCSDGPSVVDFSIDAQELQ